MKAPVHKKHSEETIYYSVAETPAGPALMASSARGVVALAFLAEVSERTALEDLRLNLGAVNFVRDDRALASVARVTQKFLSTGDAARDEIALDLRGTDFQKRVWRELIRLPRGANATYSDIARRIGKPRAVRAVATAIGDNPVSLLVPCHRVRRKDGSMGGYRWGLKAKGKLLEIELSPIRAPKPAARLAVA